MTFFKMFRRTRIHRSALFAALLILACFAVFGQRHERLITSWQPYQFDINLTLDSGLTQITSATTDVSVLIDQDNVNTIDLDFGSMPVRGVSVDGQPVRFVQHDERLDVFLDKTASRGQKLKISVVYSGKPADGLTLTKDTDGLPTAIGDNWPDRVHNWIPCLDHPSAKAPVKFTVTAPAENAVTANGAFVSEKDNSDGTRTWIYDETRPISPYNMVIAVGQFATATLGTVSPVPVSYYVSRSQGQFAEKAFAPAVPSLITFGNLIAPYPFKKLALIVGSTRFGGMENANTIVFTPTFFNNFQTAKQRSARFDIPVGMEEVEAHEIAHQWFGDTVTEKTWADLWLSEGFATYFAGLFLEQNEGKEAFHAYMRQKADSYFAYEKQRRAPIFDTQTEKLFDLLNPNNYEKGGWVLHMLRGMLGDKAFFDGLKRYYNEHKDSTATSDDLRVALEKASGKDLKGFFDRWIFKAGHPVYQITWSKAGKGSVRLVLTQMQPDEAFLQPVVLAIKTQAGERRITITPTGKESSLQIKGPVPQTIVIDPDEYILKEVVK